MAVNYYEAVSNCVRTYGHSADMLVRTLVKLVESAIENERPRLKAEVQAANRVCPKCQQPCRECSQALIDEMASLKASETAGGSDSAATAYSVTGAVISDSVNAENIIAVLRAAGVVLPVQMPAVGSIGAGQVVAVEPELTPRQKAQRARREREKATREPAE